MIFLKISLSLLGVVAILALIYFLVLLRPRKGNTPHSELLRNYAHRGLHSEGVPENSLAAFEAACHAGYGIELDVQLSKDGEIMVFHDYLLGRMTNSDKKLSELDSHELKKLKLGGSEEVIPTLDEVLELVDGRVPLLIELKGEDLNKDLCPKLAKRLSDYSGHYCIESFNPLLVGEMKKLLPNAFCGLLYTNVCREKKKRSALNIAVTIMALNFIAKPDFIAYNKEDRNALPVRVATRGHKATRFVWTIRSRDELDKAQKLGELSIFEGV